MYLTKERIDLSQFLERSEDPTGFCDGASVLFLGICREFSFGKRVLYLKYEAYEELAESQMQKMLQSAFRRWPLGKIHLLHRLGVVKLGEIALALEVRAPHRAEAYEASRDLVEEIKHRVPIWKKEYFADGSCEWGQCQDHVELQRSR